VLPECFERLRCTTTNPEETDSNFSAVVSNWDLLFGTFQTRPRAQLRCMPLGLAEVQDER
jgi:sterol desaturase/sphingolipid hydroxylase (fatty acid hydroxylase superfamily)